MNKPWGNEPDFLEFTYKGFKCFIKRNSLLALCGYVVVPEGNLCYKKEYDEIDISCHGGLTWSAMQAEGWVIGFDCCHYGDLVPKMPHYQEYVYRDIEYVKNECMLIVDQLVETQMNIRGLETSSFWAE